MKSSQIKLSHALMGFFLGSSILWSGCQENRKDQFGKINQEVLAHSEAYSNLREATTTIGHRLTGSGNGHRVEDYVYAKLKSYGFDDVMFDEFEVKAWSRDSLKVEIGGKVYAAATLGHSPVLSDVRGQIVDAGNGLASDFDSLQSRVKGNIVLMTIGLLEGSDKKLQNLHRSEKAALAIRHGAIGVIMINLVDHGVLLTGTASVTGKLIEIPAVCIGKEDGLQLKKNLLKADVHAHIFMTNHSDMIKARNVVATLQGNELPGERIIVGGHLDSWDLATGAIDNGIGSFSVIDIARAFQANHLKPKRTVQFILFMGEEQGLLGSRHFVEKASADGTLGSIRYMMNLDMSGNPIGIHAGSQLDDTLFFKNLGAEIHAIDTSFTNRFSSGAGLHSDHQPFLLEGIPTVGVISNLDRSIYKCYHADCDKFDLVNETHIRNTARFATMILYGIADAAKLPAHTLTSEQTRQYLIDSHLKEPLEIAGDWKWKQ